MSEQKYTPEPWSVSVSTHPIADTGDYYSLVSIVDRNGKTVPMFDGDDDLVDTENARRIVKCVNACKDMKDPEKEIKSLLRSYMERGGDIARIIQADAEIKRLRAELAEATRPWTDEKGTVWTPPTAWAYAQACRVMNEAKADRAALLRFAKDIASGYDHEDDAHRYNNGACRKCKAEATITQHGGQQAEEKDHV